jgi:uncharacterized membrane protein YtjA (UPF0391 family)
MLPWALILFLVMPVVAGVLGFTSIAAGTALTEILFLGFLVVYLVLLVLGLRIAGRPG